MTIFKTASLQITVSIMTLNAVMIDLMTIIVFIVIILYKSMQIGHSNSIFSTIA